MAPSQGYLTSFERYFSFHLLNVNSRICHPAEFQRYKRVAANLFSGRLVKTLMHVPRGG
jgi:hypothetical protein